MRPVDSCFVSLIFTMLCSGMLAQNNGAGLEAVGTYSVSVQGAETAVSAEDRINSYRLHGDVEGLADYSLRLVSAYRALRDIAETQEMMIADLSAERVKFLAGLDEIRGAILSERESRERLSNLLIDLEEPRWKSILQGTALGATVGAGVGRNAVSVGTGAGIGFLIEWILNHGKKTKSNSIPVGQGDKNTTRYAGKDFN